MGKTLRCLIECRSGAIPPRLGFLENLSAGVGKPERPVPRAAECYADRNPRTEDSHRQPTAEQPGTAARTRDSGSSAATDGDGRTRRTVRYASGTATFPLAGRLREHRRQNIRPPCRFARQPGLRFADEALAVGVVCGGGCLGSRGAPRFGQVWRHRRQKHRHRHPVRTGLLVYFRAVPLPAVHWSAAFTPACNWHPASGAGRRWFLASSWPSSFSIWPVFP